MHSSRERPLRLYRYDRFTITTNFDKPQHGDRKAVMGIDGEVNVQRSNFNTEEQLLDQIKYPPCGISLPATGVSSVIDYWAAAMGEQTLSKGKGTMYLPAFPSTAWERGLEFPMENKWEPLSICALHVPQ